MYYNEHYPYQCDYSCTDSGVVLNCEKKSKPGCQCNPEMYFNTETKECSYIECKNMDCVGRSNEAFFSCESGSRESCGCTPLVTLDCRTGCQCKNGYCRTDDKCVKRECKGSPFE